MEKIIEIVMNKNIMISAVSVVLGVIIYLILKKLADKLIEKNGKRHPINNKGKTYVKLISNILKYIIIIIVCVIILQVNGVDVSSIVTGLGLFSVIAGLALQDALKDIIMGFNIIIDNYFSVGDVLKIGEIEGKVTELGFKATKMVDINNGNTYVIANRNINQALKISTQLDIDIPISYDENINKIENVLEEIVRKISDLENVKEVYYRGVSEFGTSAIKYKIRMYCKQEYKPQTKRDANRIVKMELDKNNIKIPYTQIVVHNKND